jgi:hypothetical protein
VASEAPEIAAAVASEAAADSPDPR